MTTGGKLILGAGAVALAWWASKKVFSDLGQSLGQGVSFEPVPPSSGPPGPTTSGTGDRPVNPYPSFRMPPRAPAR